MAEHAQETLVHSDEVIAQQIRDFIRTYDPVKASRPSFTFSVINGVVRLEGYVANRREYRVLLDNIPHMPGVVAVDDAMLYDDESLSLTLAHYLPLGVRIRVEDGTVSLMGHIQDDTNAMELILDLAALPGVDEVKSYLKD